MKYETGSLNRFHNSSAGHYGWEGQLDFASRMRHLLTKRQHLWSAQSSRGRRPSQPCAPPCTWRPSTGGPVNSAVVRGARLGSHRGLQAGEVLLGVGDHRLLDEGVHADLAAKQRERRRARQVVLA